jgi:predicted RNA binding protein YcfA (HicA-like mRNA interferase family)
MPPRRYSFRAVQRKLLAAGFEIVGQRGSHVKFGKWVELGFITVTIPRHREAGVGTLRSVLRQSGMTWREFEEL